MPFWQHSYVSPLVLQTSPELHVGPVLRVVGKSRIQETAKRVRVTKVQVKSHVSITGVKEPMKRSHNNNEFTENSLA